MIEVMGYPVVLPAQWAGIGGPAGSLVANLLAWSLLALLAYVLLSYVLRWLTRRLPGEIEDIVLDIARRPLVLLIATYGAVSSLKALVLPGAAGEWLDRILVTVLVTTVTYLLWRVMKDVVVYYGERVARRTASPVDDVVIPLVNLFGPLILLIVAALVVLPVWGIDVTSVLLGAGVVGLVLGLALQETLSNVFSGMSLLIEAPLRAGDLLMMPDGKLCRVERLGLRSTQLYALDEHSTVYVPNKTLSNSSITNITKPTVEQKAHIDVSIGYDQDMGDVQDLLVRIAMEHPCVVATDLRAKIPHVETRRSALLLRAELLAADGADRAAALAEAARYGRAAERLECEAQVNDALLAFEVSLHAVSAACTRGERGGFTAAELRDLRVEAVEPADARCADLVARVEAWSALPDPWSDAGENATLRELWRERNERLTAKWRDLREHLSQPWKGQEQRMDDETQALACWLRDEYKLLSEKWKDPEATFRAFDACIELQLWFYIDNIRLEHYGRARRVTTEIAREIRKRFKLEQI